MKSRDWLGEFEQLVLLAVLRLGGDRAYGMQVQLEIESHTGRSCSLGALYTTLDRLEQKGFVSSNLGAPTPERGGRAKRFFKVEAAGAAALRQSYSAVRRMVQGIEPILGGGL
jgi:PadR family transcriptional regulator PadR